MLNRIKRFWKSSGMRRLSVSRAKSANRWRKLMPVWLTLDFYWSLVKLPFTWFFGAWKDRHWRNLLWGTPAVVGLIVIALLFHRVRQLQGGIAAVYWDDARVAISTGDYARAEMLLDRILQHDRDHVEDARFGLASVYEKTGNADRAELLFNALAPDDRRGYRDAHRRLAMMLSEVVTEQSSVEVLARLKWHLDAAFDKDSPAMALAWGRYAVAVRDISAARAYLEVAAEEFPELWITLGEVNTRLGNSDQAMASYKKANAHLAVRIQEQPDDRNVRVDHATVLMRQGRLDEARQILEEGLRRDPDGQWHQLLAALFVNYHDLLSVQGGHAIGELLQPIAKSLESDPNFAPALSRLMSYVNARVEGNVELKTVLARVVAEGKEPALAHLALGNVFWKEQDTEAAMFHFERALSINAKLGVVMNNLAWLVAHQQPEPDFERALGMVNTAMQQEPANGSFLDTRGTILMLMSRDKEALDDFEKSLPTVLDPAAVHAKLAVLYEKLGRAEMAEQHRVLEQELRSAAEKATPETPQRR